MRGALSGIKGVEAASYVTGPFASQLLADMGGRKLSKSKSPSEAILFAVGANEIIRRHSAV
jgi:hypothetical protein